MSAARWTSAAAVAGVVVSSVATIIIFASPGERFEGVGGPAASAEYVGASETAPVRMEVERLRAHLHSLEGQLAELTAREPNGPSAARILAARLRRSEERQQRLEEIIQQDPLEAIQIPLLQRDVQIARDQGARELAILRDSNTRELAAMRESVDRVYTLSQWLFGGIFLAVIALVINAFLPRKGKEDQDRP